MSHFYAKMVHPNNGYDHNKEQVKKLDSTVYYKIWYLEMGSQWTNIFLVHGNGTESFNSVNFEFYKLEDGEYKPYNIYIDENITQYFNKLLYKTFDNFYTCYMQDGVIDAAKIFKDEVPNLVPMLLKEIRCITVYSTLDEYAKKNYPNLYSLFSSVNSLKEELEK